MAGQISAPRSRNRCVRTLSLTAAVLATSGLFGADAAQADVYGFDWNRPAVFDGAAGPVFVSDEAGTITHMSTQYDSDAQTLSFIAAFEPEAGTGQLPEGFFLVINNGPDPKGIEGEYAILYFEAVSQASPVITAYAYNGENGADSFFDGSEGPGTQAPDPIISSRNNPSLITAATSVDNPGGRVLSFTIDATTINAHSPAYGSDANWKGIGFDENIGVWLHPYSRLTPAYNDDHFLVPDPQGTSWLTWGDYPDQGEQFHGWLDVTNEPTERLNIPEPASLALIGLGAMTFLSRDPRNA